jgi:hypothetical protein
MKTTVKINTPPKLVPTFTFDEMVKEPGIYKPVYPDVDKGERIVVVGHRGMPLFNKNYPPTSFYIESPGIIEPVNVVAWVSRTFLKTDEDLSIEIK